MTLLLTTAAAVVTTLIWYLSDRAKTMRLGTLCLAYWGAALMWTVDAVAEYLEMGADYFTPAPQEMLNDAFLGGSVIVLGLAVWTAALVVRDRLARIRAVPSGSAEKSLAE